MKPEAAWKDIALATVLFVGLAAGSPVPADTALATLRFATTCAHCHEGECSGRLSFAHDPEAAFTHIRQYAGPGDDAFARELFAALEQMKSACRYPPLAPPDLARRLTVDTLASFRDTWSGAYFLPLAGLPAGDYRLAVDLDGGGQVRVELIDAEFDPLVDRCLRIDETRLSLPLTLTDSPRHYLRLRPRGPLRILALDLEPAD